MSSLDVVGRWLRRSYIPYLLINLWRKTAAEERGRRMYGGWLSYYLMMTSPRVRARTLLHTMDGWIIFCASIGRIGRGDPLPKWVDDGWEGDMAIVVRYFNVLDGGEERKMGGRHDMEWDGADLNLTCMILLYCIFSYLFSTFSSVWLIYLRLVMQWFMITWIHARVCVIYCLRSVGGFELKWEM